MATRGLVPFCNIYSTFMQRAYDQVIHDVAIQNLHVVFCLDRGGLVGADGPTHHGVYDLAYMRCIPNLVVSAPLDEQALRNLMYTASQKHDGPLVIRYPRGTGSMVNWQTPFVYSLWMPSRQRNVVTRGRRWGWLILQRSSGIV